MTTTKQLLDEVDALLVKTIRALKDAQQFRDSGFKPWKEEEAESHWREQIAQEIEADTVVLTIKKELLDGKAIVHPDIKTHYANIARGK